MRGGKIENSCITELVLLRVNAVSSPMERSSETSSWETKGRVSLPTGFPFLLVTGSPMTVNSPTLPECACVRREVPNGTTCHGDRRFLRKENWMCGAESRRGAVC